MNLKLSSLIFLTALSTFSFAQDRQFARTYQSLTLPKGAKDLEVWNTLRTGKEKFYRRLDQRIEFEVGVTDRLQTAFYLNASHQAAAIGDSIISIAQGSSFSFSNEWKYKISDPVANVIGSGLYFELGVAPDEIELEGKILLDKKIDNHLFAFNAVYEMEYETEIEANGETEVELEATPMEFDLAYMYNFKPNFGLGVEMRSHHEITPKDGLEHAAFFAGPTLFYSGDKYFLILNIQPQITNLYKSPKVPDSLDLDEYEKNQVRLLVGFSF